MGRDMGIGIPPVLAQNVTDISILKAIEQTNELLDDVMEIQEKTISALSLISDEDIELD